MTTKILYYINAFESVFVNTPISEYVKSGNNYDDTRRLKNISYKDILSFILSPRAESTAVELLSFLEPMSLPLISVPDFSKRRQKIDKDVVRGLLYRSVACYYGNCGCLNLWHDHLLLAGDGTTYAIPANNKLKEKFLQGRQSGPGNMTLARGVVLNDTLNDKIVAANCECYSRDEIELLGEIIGNIPDSVKKLKPVIFLDRKYCAYTMMQPLLDNDTGFIIRVKYGFNNELDKFMDSKDESRVVTLVPRSTTIKKIKRRYGIKTRLQYKVLALKLSAGVTVITSLVDESADGLRGLYHLRWTDETTIGCLKNTLEIEIFSSTKFNSLLQDFYSKIICYNLLSDLVAQAAKMRPDYGKDRRVYKIDRSVALGILKVYFSRMFLEGGNSFKKYSAIVLKQMSRHVVCSDPNRHLPHLFRKIKSSGKYITLTNYREAI